VLPAGAASPAAVRRSATADFAAVRAAAEPVEAKAARSPIALHRAGAGTGRLFNPSTAVARAAEILEAASPAAVLQFNPSRVPVNLERGIPVAVNPVQANRRLRSQETQGPDLESRDRIGPEPANLETGPETGRVMGIDPVMATDRADPAKVIDPVLDPETATDPADREKVTVPEIGLETVIVRANPEKVTDLEIGPAMAIDQVNPAKAIARVIDPETATDPADPEKATVREIGPETVIVRANPEKATDLEIGRAMAIDRVVPEKATDPVIDPAMATGPETATGQVIDRAIVPATDPVIDPITAIGPVPDGRATPTLRAADRRTGMDIGRMCITPGTTATGTAIGITAARIGTPIRGAPGASPEEPSASRPG
jgi:hypothetical protein